MSSLFTGLSAFPLTPASIDGVVDTDALGILVERLAAAGVDSIGLLGSTGGYAYLNHAERARAVVAAVEAAAGRVPIVVGIGALRTSWAQELAREAERGGASGLLLAPMSYTPLTVGEVAEHYRAVSGTTGLPLCIYNNPGTTNFSFSEALIAQLAAEPGIAAIKMPPAADADYESEISQLRATTPASFAIGYSGDWAAAPSLMAGADAWYSVVAGLLPEPALRLTRAAQAGRASEVAAIDATAAPLWALFRAHGSLRIMYAVAESLAVSVGDPPAPVQRVNGAVVEAVAAAVDALISPPRG